MYRMRKQKILQQGAVNGAVITSIVLGVLVVILGSVAIWAVINYNDWRNDVQGRINVAVSDARRVQAEEDEARFAEREKEPYDRFIGPDDLGRVEFNYPKTWSVHVARAGGNQPFEAFLHPDVVPPINKNQTQYALRVEILNRGYEDVVRSYENRVERGDLRVASVAASGFNGTRYDGNLNQNFDGSMVIFQIRDKTLVVRTDAPVYRPDFDNIVLPSLTFSP